MLTRRVRIVIFGLAGVILLVGRPASARTWYVASNGNDQADGRTAGTSFKTILRAAERLNHGDSIVIAPGSYTESAFLAERFSADGAPMSVIGDETGKLTGTRAGAVIVRPARPTGVALHFYRFRNLRISGLTFSGPGQGLKLERCRGMLVERSSFDRLTRGLIAEGARNLRVESSVFTRCTVGLFVHGSVDTRIAHVTLTGTTSVGVLALASGAGMIRNAILCDNNTNMIADAVSAPAWSSDHNVLHGNNGAWGAVPPVANAYEWFAASGQDRHSVYVVPAFRDAGAFDLHVAPAVTWGGGLPGMDVGGVLEPKVPLDRDGRPFRVRDGTVCAGAYDYPDPRPAPGWAKLDVALDAADGRGSQATRRQSAGIYRDDGTLVRMLLADVAGVRTLWWDGRDDLGQVAGPGRFTVRSVSHDVRIVDDGAMGDNGNPMGAYNCDNADQVGALPDGGFIITTPYDEAGYALRRYASSGQPAFANNLAAKAIRALARSDGEDLYCVEGQGGKERLLRLVLPGERAPMRSGAEDYPVAAKGDKKITHVGLAVDAASAYVSLSGPDVIRVIDLASGRKKADWPVPGVAAVARDAAGTLWAITGTDLVALTPSGAITKRYATGLPTPRYLAAGHGRLAVVDRQAAKIALLDAATGRALRTLGRTRPPGAWTPVSADVYRDPRGAAFLPDGRLIVTEQARVRILWPDTGKIAQDILSNFMDVALPHPTRPEYVYCALGVFHVDPKSGAWEWLVEEPRGSRPGKDGKPESLWLGSPATSVVLDGRPFLVYYQAGRLRMFDVSNPLRPRAALDRRDRRDRVLNAWAYATLCFTKGGDLVTSGHYTLEFNVVPYKGLDKQNNPVFDFAAVRTIGYAKDPSARGMKSIAAVSADPRTGDIYYLAVTARRNKMVPGWGADGTGVARTTPAGKPLWFSPSSGGNYMSIDMVDDGQQAWILAGKSFGGQIDLFDEHGLRLGTGNWSWPCHYQIGFVDLRFGVQAYMRPDGKVGAYVEDDAVGRFGRARVDGMQTLKKHEAAIDWKPTRVAAGPAPDAGQVGSASATQRLLVIPHVPPLAVDGDWAAWAKAGVVPQILALPVPGFKRSFPDDLWQTFRAGTAIGAIAHDDANFYVYFVVTDDTMHFDAERPGQLWMFDGVELWLEEEQFGLALTRDGTPHLFKFRFHNRAGKQWSANYGLPRADVWAKTFDDLSVLPLGRQLATITGVSFKSRKGYAVMGRIPFAEVKLVGGIGGSRGRKGTEILNMTGKPGEIVRVGVAFGGISAWGREQDFKVNWPASLMFSDPTRSTAFVLGK